MLKDPAPAEKPRPVVDGPGWGCESWIVIFQLLSVS